jgi:stress-induced-phosphoprotein 1
MAISSGMNSNDKDEDRYRHAMADPEIQQILSDPQMQLNLKKMQEDPSFAMQCMQDPEMSKAINKLIAAGVIKTK